MNSKKLSKEYNETCKNCKEDKTVYQNTCKHKLCGDCWAKHIRNNFFKKNKSILDVKCPYRTCDEPIMDFIYKNTLNAEELEDYENYLALIPDKPTCLADFNYTFDDQGKLKSTIDGKGFRWVGQNHYDALGDLVLQNIQEQLSSEFCLEEIILPLDEDKAKQKEGKSRGINNIFISPDFLTAEDVAVIIIQGSGAVRPGQWARALCINDSLKTGTIFSYLKCCRERGWPVIVLNPNQNRSPPNQLYRTEFPSRDQFLSSDLIKKQPIKPEIVIGSESPEKHSLYVWDNFVSKSTAKRLLIVAHSYGGMSVSEFADERTDDLYDRVKAIALTDSFTRISDDRGLEFLKDNCINWVASSNPLDTPEKFSSNRSGYTCLSAGHTKHEYTSEFCYKSVFKFFDKKIGINEDEDEDNDDDDNNYINNEEEKGESNDDDNNNDDNNNED